VSFIQATLLAAVLALVGCDLDDVIAGSARFKEDFHFSHALAPGGRLSVESFNGSVEVVGWDRDEVEITGTKYASSEELLDALEIDFVGTDDLAQVRTVRPSGRRGNMGAKYVIHAPERARLDRLTTSNGSIKVDGFESDARLRTSNGKITVSRLRGHIEADTSNGAIALEDTRGQAVVSTSNGSIQADRVLGRFEAHTSNGSITAHIVPDEGGSPIQADSSNGSITLTLEEPPTSDVRATTSNATVTVYLPDATRADISANTSNSSIRTEFDVLVSGLNKKKTELRGSINGGGPQVRLSTSNGGIRIFRLTDAEI
jgi:hypothetical protein